MAMNDAVGRNVMDALDAFEIELPSWGFADTGTRFGKFHQDAAASTTDEKFHDAGLVHRLTGCCPSVAVHVLWDFAPGDDPARTKELAARHGVRVGSINPNLFQDQAYKFGSFCSPSGDAREAAMRHTLDCVRIGRAVGSGLLSLWLADGTNYPGQDNLRDRKRRLQGALKDVHAAMEKEWPGAALLLEYKPFEPAFYHTDVADWGMSYVFCKHAGPHAKVLVDTGHHFQGQNVEHIVSFLLDENMLGGFHFNDRRYADDDLTFGSIDPYAAFRIFDAVMQHAHDTGARPQIAYMVDQSHNLKPKLEAMVQTVCEAQKLFAKSATVDRKRLADARARADVVGSETILRQAFERDVTPTLQEWRQSRGLAADPLEELRGSGVIERLGKDRRAAREARGQKPGGSAYA